MAFSNNLTGKSSVASRNNRTCEAVSDGKRARVNNLGLVNNNLVYFGLDYLTLNIVNATPKNARSILFIDSIFSVFGNDTNASDIDALQWGSSDIQIGVSFSYNQYKDPIATVLFDNIKVCSIQWVQLHSPFRKNITYQYKYRIQFYSGCFSLVRLGKFTLHDLLSLFSVDIENGLLKYSISRVDICADVINVTPLQVQKSIVIISKKHAKKINEHGKDMSTGEVESFEYGRRSDKWHARVYDKKLEIEARKKARRYPDYLDYESVTRIEVELRSGACRDFAIAIHDCFDIEKLLSIYSACLYGKYVKWEIVPFIQEGMTRNGFRIIPIKKIKRTYKLLPKHKRFNRARKMCMRISKDFDMPIEEVLKRIHFHIERDA